MSTNYNKGPIEKIGSALIEGLSTGDLSGLNDAVEDSVNAIINNVGDSISKIGDVKTNGEPRPLSGYNGKSSYGDATKAAQDRINAEKARERARQEKINKQKAEAEQKRLAANASKVTTALPVPFKPVGNVSSVLCMTGGGIGMTFTAINVLKNIGFLIAGVVSPAVWIANGVFLVLFGSLINVGIGQKKRLDKAKRYAALCGTSQYIELDRLASAANQSPRKTLSDLKKMFKKGFFPQGHIDDEKTTVMFSDNVYAEYLRSVNGRKAIEDKKNEPIDTTAREVDPEQEKIEKELNQMINEGNDYIVKLHKLNQDIPGETITEKLDRLEALLKEVFECVRRHPDQMSKMHEVMSYYLPTVLKLVEAYKEYDMVSEPGDEIIDAKAQIEVSIDKINGALRKILNNLFRDSVWDVTTDATVLNTVLAQKGLASPFDENN